MRGLSKKKNKTGNEDSSHVQMSTSACFILEDHCVKPHYLGF